MNSLLLVLQMCRWCKVCHIFHSNLITITSEKHKTDQGRSVALQSEHCAKLQKRETLYLNTTQIRIYNYNIKPAEIFSVFGIKWHRTQFDFDVSHVSVCASSWSFPLASAVWSRSGSLLLSLLMPHPRRLLWVCVGSFKRPAAWFQTQRTCEY